MSDRTIIKLPFPGFYDSWYSDELDVEEEREAENLAEREEEEGHPVELRLNASEFAELLFDVTDYSAAKQAIARQYVSVFDEWFANQCSTWALGLEFESMSSPREYNFSTDRIFAWIPCRKVQALFNMVNRDTLAAVIRERFTSCSGFISHYSNDISDWLEKPLTDWDHNELETLLLAVIRDKCNEPGDYDMAIFYSMAESEDFYQAHSNAVDWPKLEEKATDKREEKADEIRADDPDYVPSATRCARTVDMFTGKEG